jgi:hypothetical protein
LVRDELPEGVTLKSLGRHRLKDIRRPEHIHQLDIRGSTTGVALPDHLASNLYIGSTYSGDLQAEAVMDEVEIH